MSGEDYDPSIAYCVEGCGELAVGETLIGVTDDVFDDPEDFTEIVSLVCYDHAQKEAA